MKFVTDRYGIKVIPENDQDVAYIEDTLGLREKDAYTKLKRTNASGMGCIAYLETEKRKSE